MLYIHVYLYNPSVELSKRETLKLKANKLCLILLHLCPGLRKIEQNAFLFKY